MRQPRGHPHGKSCGKKETGCRQKVCGRNGVGTPRNSGIKIVVNAGGTAIAREAGNAEGIAAASR